MKYLLNFAMIAMFFGISAKSLPAQEMDPQKQKVAEAIEKARQEREENKKIRQDFSAKLAQSNQQATQGTTLTVAGQIVGIGNGRISLSAANQTKDYTVPAEAVVMIAGKQETYSKLWTMILNARGRQFKASIEYALKGYDMVVAKITLP